MDNTMVKNPMPKVKYFKELFDSIASNLALMLFFNPAIQPYTMGGDRSIVSEAIFCSLLTTMIVVIGVSKSIRLGRFNGEISGARVSNKWLKKLPVNRWLLGLTACIVTVPLGVFVILFIFNFYGFESWTFYQFFWIRFIYSTLLSKALVIFIILRNIQPDCDPSLLKRL
jgi:hypothetical protein